jgi:hypothetical protein
MVVVSAPTDAMVTVVVFGGGMTVVTKWSEHSSAPAGFQYSATSIQYVFSKITWRSLLLGGLTSIAVILGTESIRLLHM